MVLFISIGATWVTGMLGYMLFTKFHTTTKHRCNVRQEVLAFKALETTKTRKVS